VLDENFLQTTLGVQSAIAGAGMADNKCSALGAELVKVFHMLLSYNKTSMLQKMKDMNWGNETILLIFTVDE